MSIDKKLNNNWSFVEKINDIEEKSKKKKEITTDLSQFYEVMGM